MSRKLQVKRGNEADMPNLAAGEMGFALDTKKMFVGTGMENVPINSGRMQEEAEEVAEISTNVATINHKVGLADDITGSTINGSIFGKLNVLLNKFTESWTDARAAKLDKLDNVDTTMSSRASASTALSTATWTGARAGYLDYLADTTYGLSAIKTSVNDSSAKIGTTTDTGGTSIAGTVMGKLNAIYANSKNAGLVKSVRRGTGNFSGGSIILNIGSVNPSKCHATVYGTVMTGSTRETPYIASLGNTYIDVSVNGNVTAGGNYISYEIVEFY